MYLKLLYCAVNFYYKIITYTTILYSSKNIYLSLMIQKKKYTKEIIYLWTCTLILQKISVLI